MAEKTIFMKTKFLLTLSLFFFFVANSCTEVRLKEWKEVDRAIEIELKEVPLPIKLDAGVYMTKLLRDENTVIITVEFNESRYDFREMQYEMTSKMKSRMAYLEDSEYFYKFLKNKGMDIEFKFIGSISNKSFDIFFPNKEIGNSNE